MLCSIHVCLTKVGPAWLTHGKNKRRHTVESHVSCPLAVVFHKGPHQSTRSFNIDLCLWFLALVVGNPAVVQGIPGDSYGSVTTHRGVVMIVNKDGTDVGFRMTGLHQNGTIHIVMAPWFCQTELPEVVVMVHCAQALVHDTISLQFRVTINDEACWLTSCMHLTSADGKVLAQAHRGNRTGGSCSNERWWTQLVSFIAEEVGDAIGFCPEIRMSPNDIYLIEVHITVGS